MQSHTPSFWLWDDPEACHRRFELVHGLEDKKRELFTLNICPMSLETERNAVW